MTEPKPAPKKQICQFCGDTAIPPIRRISNPDKRGRNIIVVDEGCFLYIVQKMEVSSLESWAD